MATTDQGAAHDTLTQLVADALIGEYGPAQFATPSEVIAALLAGGHIREEWGARYLGDEPTDDRDSWPGGGSRKAAGDRIAARERRGWWTPSVLIRRFVVVTAATVVEEPLR